MLQQVLLKQQHWFAGRDSRHNFGKRSSKDQSTKVKLQLVHKFQANQFKSEFSLGSYVKLSLSAAVILDGGQECWTQFWKKTTKGPFHLSCWFHQSWNESGFLTFIAKIINATKNSLEIIFNKPYLNHMKNKQV